MQFLAFLKDSFREARSGWVLQAMLVLSALLVLFVASISFSPATVDQTVRSRLRLLNFAFKQNGASFEIENYSATNPAEPWNSDYAFDYVVHTASEDQRKQFERDHLPSTEGNVRGFLKELLGVVNNLKVETVRVSPTESRFHVTSRGTKVEEVTAWLHVPTALFAVEMPYFIRSLRSGVFTVEKYIVGWVGAWVVLFISVIITSSFIPNLLQKGAVDLAISKPITRWRLLVYKYVGGLIFTAILTAVTVGGSWLAIGLRTGMWNNNFLIGVPLILAYFSILYAVSTLTAVFTRSTIVAILATLLAWVFFWALGEVNRGIVDREKKVAAQKANPNALPIPDPNDLDDVDGLLARIDPEAPLWGFIPQSTFGVVKAVHLMSPRTFQIDEQLDRVTAQGILTPAELKRAKIEEQPASVWIETLGVSAAFVIVILGVASWRFSTRSY